MRRDTLQSLGSGLTVALCLLFVRCDGKLINLGQTNQTPTAGSTHDNGGTASSGSSSGAGGTSASGGTSSKKSTGGTAGASSSSTNTGFVAPLFENVTLIKELGASAPADKDENPSLTADMLELYFYSTRRHGDNSDDDIWVSKRSKVTDAWGAPVVLTPVSTDGSETSPAVSANGLSIWVGVKLDGGLGNRDIWRFDRPSRDADFGATPTNEPQINTAFDDIPRPLGNRERTMPLASRPGDETTAYQTFFASREAATGDFGTPQTPSELTANGEKLSDGFLTDDGLNFYFVMGTSETKGDIYVTKRASLTAPFVTPLALSSINTTAYDERDPWLSPDGNTLYFVSTRTDDVTRIYRATRVQ